jgi:hypothetical protein
MYWVSLSYQDFTAIFKVIMIVDTKHDVYFLNHHYCPTRYASLQPTLLRGNSQSREVKCISKGMSAAVAKGLQSSELAHVGGRNTRALFQPSSNSESWILPLDG